MLKRFSIVLCFLLMIPFCCYGADVSAASAVVIDGETKKILFEKDAYSSRSMASTTKIMTAILALESNRLDNLVKVNAQMIAVEGSSLGLRENDTITLYDLVVGMMLTSGNDSANTVAYYLGGSLDAFQKMMNDKAKELGLSGTSFVTPSGLDDKNHYSTAYDMALLTAYAIENKTFCSITDMQKADITISGNKITVYNHNKLLGMDEDIFGVKTGYTSKSGRCLVSAKEYKGNSIICVTLNAADDWNDHLKLFKEAQAMYSDSKLTGDVDVNVVGGNRPAVKCSYSGEFCGLAEAEIKLYYHPFLYAPIKTGDTIGYAAVYYNNKLIERLPIEADEDVEYYGGQK
ncbi:MAG: D-alanyl-D-alanine carboxypeptidase [Clostridium sp.]|nr:D-alanyl-D-alanine carboxypeptidase [Clostridium sp.]